MKSSEEIFMHAKTTYLENSGTEREYTPSRKPEVSVIECGHQMEG